MARNLRKEHADATRGQLLEAALRVISQKGYGAATIDDIVKEAGVSKGAAYYHFHSKADLASSILEMGIKKLTEGFRHCAENSKNAEEALTGILKCFCAMVVEKREFGRFFLMEWWREGRAWSDEMASAENELVSIVAAQLARGQREGCVLVDIDPTFNAIAIIGTVLTTSVYYLDPKNGAHETGEEFTERIVDIVSHGTVAPGYTPVPCSTSAQ